MPISEHVPAVVEDRAPVVADTDSWIGVVAEVAKFAGYIASTDFVPKSLRDSPAATTAAIMYGREVGLGPMTALTQTHVIEGRPAMSAEAMRALILAAGHDIEVLESTGAICTVRGRRHGQERWSAPVSWTIDAARLAGLANKSNWKSYPRQMLQARATAELARLVFPDVIHGFRALEEFDDEGAEETAPALPTPGTKVSRAKATKKAVASLPAPREERPEPTTGPPLPGEEGYETSAGEAAPGEGVRPSPQAGTGSERAGGGAPDSSPAEAQTTEAGPVGEPAEGSDGAAPAEAVGTVTEEPPGEDEGEASEPGDSEAPPPRAPRKATRAQHRMIFALLEDLGIDKDNADRHDIASAITHRRVESFNDLTHDNATAIIDTLGRVKSRDELDELLAAAAKAEADLWNQGDRS